MKIIPYGRQQITEEDKKAVLEALESDFLTQGPRVEEFEKKFAAYIQAEHAVAVTNGTAALHLAAMALDVKPGDKVLCTPNTFVASANCIRYCGGDVEFVDIDPNNYCLDLTLLEQKLAAVKPGTYKGVVCVDFAGYPVDFEKLRAIAGKYKLWIIEDACHAVGAQFKNSAGEWVYSGNGRYADVSVFSFHPVKHLATGEGGMIVTNRKELDKKLRLYRTHGITRDPSELKQNDGAWYYEMQALGFNYRIPDLNCALGTSQLSRIESNLQRRREIAARYDEAFAEIGLAHQETGENIRNGYHLYVIQTSRRDELYAQFREQGVYCQVHYIPVHKQPYYKSLYGEISLPIAEKFYAQALSLPMFHSLSNSDQDRVIQIIKEFFKSRG